MKKIFIAIVLLSLVSGCATNRATVKNIQELDQQFNDDVSHDREIHFQQQNLRYRLLDRGYLDRKECLIYGFKPQGPEWDEVLNRLTKHLKSGESKVGLIEFGDYNLRTSKPVHITIWDRPDAMAGWKILIQEISKKEGDPEAGAYCHDPGLLM